MISNFSKLFPLNISSIVIEKLKEKGIKEIGIKKEFLEINGEMRDHKIFILGPRND